MATSNETTAPRAAPASLYAWFVVVVLALANCVSYIDRLILGLLVKDIKLELGLTDTMFGLLAGATFAIFYCTMGLVIARWADRYSRKWIVTAGITLWCLMTTLAGTAKNQTQLFLYRIGVGAGEATLSPSAYSLLANYFPPQRLSLAIGVFSAGVTAGAGLAFLLGGALIGWVYSHGPIQLPLFGIQSGWRAVMILVGLLGLPVAALMLLVREPPRSQGFKPAPSRDLIAHFRTHWRKYIFVFVGYGTTSVTAFAVMTWTPALYSRRYGETVPAGAALLGTVALLGGLAGAFSGGWLADRWHAQGDPRAKLRVLMLCGFGLLLPSVIAPFMPTAIGHASVIFFTFFFGTAATGPAGAYIQTITPDNMRAQFGAAHQLSLTLAGATLGPFLVGFFNDFLFKSEQALHLSMALVSAIANPIAAWFLWRAFRNSDGR